MIFTHPWLWVFCLLCLLFVGLIYMIARKQGYEGELGL